MDGIEPPSRLFKDVQRHYTAQRGSSDPSPVAKMMPLKLMELYTRTASSFHNWQTAHPRSIARAKGGTGDVIDEMFDEILTKNRWNEETVVKIHWPTVAVLAKNR